MMMMRGSILLVVVVVAFLFVGPSLAQQRDCTIDDYTATYTACRADNKRDLVYFLNQPVTCSVGGGGGGFVPPYKYNLSCNLACDEGYYLPMGETQCAQCSPGSYSRGGALLFSQFYDWPSSGLMFNTYCLAGLRDPVRASCPGWQLEGAYMMSGNVTDSQASVLELNTIIVSSIAHVHFTYRVDAERNYDFFYFEVDGVIVLPKTSFTLTYVDFRANLTAGYHTLRWIYAKDVSLSGGEDAAFIDMIEVSGTRFADDACTPCHRGTATEKYGSEKCDDCPLNTYADSENMTSCKPCPTGTYSFEGSPSCLPRLACTEKDFDFNHTKCEGPKPGTQLLQYHWLEPIICDPSNSNSVHLPPAEPLACGPCDSGFYRDERTYQCVACASGSYTDGKGTNNDGFTTCTSCNAGQAAIKEFNITNFDAWMPNSDTGCAGKCGSPGWRLRGDFIDSGVGHGLNVDVWFSFDVELYQPGTLSFQYFLNCSLCKLTFSTEGPNGNLNGSIANAYAILGRNVDVTLDLPMGRTTLFFNFNKQSTTFDSSEEKRRNDLVRLNYIFVDGVEDGGASSCTPCSQGSVANQGAYMCTNCTAGFQSNAESTNCVACPPGQFSSVSGLPCRLCGEGTVPTADRTSCTLNCTYTLPGTSSTFDFSPLSQPSFYTPPIVISDHTYLLSVCNQVPAKNTTCYDDEGKPLVTSSCQITPDGYGIDLGNLLAYAPLADYADSVTGLDMIYTGGLAGCARFYNKTDVPRQTVIHFLCDTTAGKGIPVPKGALENKMCVYEFEWRSLYACPECSMDDVEEVYGPCVYGKRQIHYYWADNPTQCHDGIKLPPTRVVNCTITTLTCPAGMYVKDDGGNASDEETCVACPGGTFSLGGGLRIDNWNNGGSGDDGNGNNNNNQLPPGFNHINTCTGGQVCSQWRVAPDGRSLLSGVGSSALGATYTFNLPGTVKFHYQVYISQSGSFGFFIDGVIRLYEGAQKIMTQPREFFFDVEAGVHNFKWSFFSGRLDSPNALDFEGAYLYDIEFMGLDSADAQCTPCAPGWVSSSNSSSCRQCPANTYANGRHTYCIQCSAIDANSYSMPGSEVCLPRPTCSDEDYYLVYGDCTMNGDGTLSRSASYTRKMPSICLDGPLAYRPPAPAETQCAPCPDGLYRDGAQCKICADGTYVDPSSPVSDPPCKAPEGDHYLYKELAYFTTDGDNHWSAEWQTGCHGDGCFNSSGWRIRESCIESSDHLDGRVDSWVSLYIQIDASTYTTEASVHFLYDVDQTGPQNNGLFFLIDEVPHMLISTTSGEQTFPLNVGAHSLKWIAHKEAGGGSTVSARVRSIRIRGSVRGPSFASVCPAGTSTAQKTSSDVYNCALCPPGTFSAVSGASECTRCPAGTFASSQGSTGCEPCPAGTYTEGEGAAYCITNCSFTLRGGQVVDLSRLDSSSSAGSVSDSDHNTYYISPCEMTYCNPTFNPNADKKTHVCINTLGGDVLDGGSLLASVEQYNNTETAFDFLITYSGGDSFGCEEGANGRELQLGFACDENSGRGSPQFLAYSSDTRCTSLFMWRSLYACPLCTANDYVTVYTPCESGVRRVIRERVNPCNDMYSKLDNANNVEETCSGFEVSSTIIIVVVLALVVLVIILIFVSVRNRLLTRKYSRLINRDDNKNPQFELDEPNVLHDDDDDDDLNINDNNSRGRGSPAHSLE
eukprot:TRINITY_DN599_c0_g1_i2.p1 TRINITY_DN599_c0_g1~~TRINITY_DN599_c0_g1_i2.p1  ORF type:complete len:1691 (+),score=310.04 TRINITY_DN599_c0_g1_i2:2107-7179(+)